MLVRVHTHHSPVRERERGGGEMNREGERERGRERDVEYGCFIFKRNDGCLGTF